MFREFTLNPVKKFNPPTRIKRKGMIPDKLFDDNKSEAAKLSPEAFIKNLITESQFYKQIVEAKASNVKLQ